LSLKSDGIRKFCNDDIAATNQQVGFYHEAHDLSGVEQVQIAHQMIVNNLTNP
jgi:hypothetical protein